MNLTRSQLSPKTDPWAPSKKSERKPVDPKKREEALKEWNEKKKMERYLKNMFVHQALLSI
jgi:hypothetical protein